MTGSPTRCVCRLLSPSRPILAYKGPEFDFPSLTSAAQEEHVCAFDAVTLEFLWRAGTGVRTIAVCGNELYAANNASRQHIYRQHRGRVEVFSFKGQCP